MQNPQNPYGAYMGGSQWHRTPDFAGTYGVVGDLDPYDPRRGGRIPSTPPAPGQWPSQLMSYNPDGYGTINMNQPWNMPQVQSAGHIMPSDGGRNQMLAQLRNQNAIARGANAAGNGWAGSISNPYGNVRSGPNQGAQSFISNFTGGGGGSPLGSISKIAQFASKFKPGNTISSLFSQGGSVNSLLGKSALGSSIGAAPAWALPVAGLAIGGGLAYLNKRSKQKKEQKFQMGQRDLIKQAHANGQYLTGGLGNFGPAKPY